MSQPATVEAVAPVVTDTDANWESESPAPTREVTVQEGDWEVSSASRELPSEESLRRAMTEEAPAPDTEFEVDDSGAANADEAIAQENARREAEAAGETKPDEKADAAGEKGKKKSKPLETRVEQERARLARVRFERGEEERRLEALRREVAELDAKKASAGTEGAKPSAPAEEPSWDDYDAQGKSFNDFLKDHTAWLEQKFEAKREAEKRAELAKAEEAQQARAADEFRATVAQRIDEARAAHEDFDTAIEALAEIKIEEAPFLHDAITLHPQGGEIMYFLAQHVEDVAKPLLMQPIRPFFLDALQETSHPTALLSHLAAHPSVTEKIARSHPASALVALGRLLAQVEGAPAGPPSTASVTTAIPPPSARVDGSRRVAGPRAAPDPDEPPGGWVTD